MTATQSAIPVAIDTQSPPTRDRRRRRRSGVDTRPGFLTYGLMIAFVAGFAYPLWWSFVVASGTAPPW